jgi:TRAP-type C4-dicarboxylate transport system permease small subunit
LAACPPSSSAPLFLLGVASVLGILQVLSRFIFNQPIS